MDFNNILKLQKDFFNSNKTKEVTYRINELKRLKSVLQKNEALLYEAIDKDFKKSKKETYLTELSLIYHEIDIAVKKVKKWSRKKRVAVSIANLPAKAYIVPEPLGVSLIIGAWNYPYQLSIAPAIAAIAAGCTVILKPSELPAHTSAVMKRIINENFDPHFFTVIEGGVEETTALLKLDFDKIFFTGSVPVGKIVYQAAAEHLTPVTLELGGKSPAIITADADIDMTAKRLVWSKFLNAGQTCIAPDYVLVEESIKSKFLDAVVARIKTSDYQTQNENYTQIINQKNYDRLVALIDNKKVYYGGKSNAASRIIEPTILSDVSWEDRIMEDEIFGPILPVVTFNDIDEAIAKIKSKPKPLSCYVYTKSADVKKRIVSEISFGGGAINDSVMHVVEPSLPFGGVGHSGMGNYHGKFGFDAFSHHKSVLQKSFWIELNLKHPPYTDFKFKWLKRLIG